MEKKETKQKKPYEKPVIVSHRIFESNALACGKCQNKNQVALLTSCSRGRTVTS